MTHISQDLGFDHSWYNGVCNPIKEIIWIIFDKHESQSKPQMTISGVIQFNARAPWSQRHFLLHRL